MKQDFISLASDLRKQLESRVKECFPNVRTKELSTGTMFVIGAAGTSVGIHVTNTYTTGLNINRQNGVAIKLDKKVDVIELPERDQIFKANKDGSYNWAQIQFRITEALGQVEEFVKKQTAVMSKKELESQAEKNFTAFHLKEMPAVNVRIQGGKYELRIKDLDLVGAEMVVKFLQERGLGGQFINVA